MCDKANLHKNIASKGKNDRGKQIAFFWYFAGLIFVDF